MTSLFVVGKEKRMAGDWGGRELKEGWISVDVGKSFKSKR
jgi:hypothetical protein